LTPANLLLSLKLQKPFLAALRVLSGVFLHRVISAIREAIVGALGRGGHRRRSGLTLKP